MLFSQFLQPHLTDGYYLCQSNPIAMLPFKNDEHHVA
jgi:hypothetical protein